MVRNDIRDAIKNKKLIIGSNKILKFAKAGDLVSIFYALNCPKERLKDIEHYSKITGIELKQFNGNSVQLGEICGKPFGVLLAGSRK